MLGNDPWWHPHPSRIEDDFAPTHAACTRCEGQGCSRCKWTGVVEIDAEGNVESEAAHE